VIVLGQKGAVSIGRPDAKITCKVEIVQTVSGQLEKAGSGVRTPPAKWAAFGMIPGLNLQSSEQQGIFRALAAQRRMPKGDGIH
jgi:hypothetical protein